MPELILPARLAAERVSEAIDRDLIELSDGRRLKRIVHEKIPGMRLWQAPDGMLVGAFVKQTAKHGPLLNLSIQYAARRPSWDDVRRVREAFFAARDAFIPFGRDDDGGETAKASNRVDLWEMPRSWSSQ